MLESASPQLENGHTRIANELLEEIVRYPFCATELKIILFIIRKTYGWGKKTNVLSYGVIAKGTKSDIRYIKRLMNRLVRDKILIKVNSKQQNLFGLNKDYTSWRLWKTQDDNILQTTGGGGLETTRISGLVSTEPVVS